MSLCERLIDLSKAKEGNEVDHALVQLVAETRVEAIREEGDTTTRSDPKAAIRPVPPSELELLSTIFTLISKLVHSLSVILPDQPARIKIAEHR